METIPSVRFVLVCMISFIIIIIIACQVRCGLETASFWLENPAHRSWLAGNDIIAGLPCDDQAFLAGALFSFTTSPHLSLFSLSLLLWCGFSAPFANNSHYTPYVLFPLSFISLLFSSRTSFAAFLALLPCENPCMQAHDSPPIADSWMTSSSPLPLRPPPVIASSIYQNQRSPPVRMCGWSFLAQIMCSYIIYCIINYKNAIFSFALTRVHWVPLFYSLKLLSVFLEGCCATGK